jgi:hypothetical protein
VVRRREEAVGERRRVSAADQAGDVNGIGKRADYASNLPDASVPPTVWGGLRFASNPL